MVRLLHSRGIHACFTFSILLELYREFMEILLRRGTASLVSEWLAMKLTSRGLFSLGGSGGYRNGARTL
jgi:hypothetical protein